MEPDDEDEGDSYCNTFTDLTEGSYWPHSSDQTPVYADQTRLRQTLFSFMSGRRDDDDDDDQSPIISILYMPSTYTSASRSDLCISHPPEDYNNPVPPEMTTDKTNSSPRSKDTKPNVVKPAAQMLEKKCDRSSDFLKTFWGNSENQINVDKKMENEMPSKQCVKNKVKTNNIQGWQDELTIDNKTERSVTMENAEHGSVGASKMESEETSPATPRTVKQREDTSDIYMTTNSKMEMSQEDRDTEVGVSDESRENNDDQLLKQDALRNDDRLHNSHKSDSDPCASSMNDCILSEQPFPSNSDDESVTEMYSLRKTETNKTNKQSEKPETIDELHTNYKSFNSNIRSDITDEVLSGEEDIKSCDYKLIQPTRSHNSKILLQSICSLMLRKDESITKTSDICSSTVTEQCNETLTNTELSPTDDISIIKSSEECSSFSALIHDGASQTREVKSIVNKNGTSNDCPSPPTEACEKLETDVTEIKPSNNENAVKSHGNINNSHTKTNNKSPNGSDCTSFQTPKTASASNLKTSTSRSSYQRKTTPPSYRNYPFSSLLPSCGRKQEYSQTAFSDDEEYDSNDLNAFSNLLFGALTGDMKAMGYQGYAKQGSHSVNPMLNQSYYMKWMIDFADANGFEVKDVLYDGNCMFCAVADQLKINGQFDYTARLLRHKAVSYLRDHPDSDDGSPLSDFLSSETWDEYLCRMEKDKEWGDHMILNALSEVVGRTIVVVNPYDNDFRQTEISPKSGNAASIKSFFLGHLGEFHYMSLRPADWETEWPKAAKIERMKIISEEESKRKLRYELLLKLLVRAKNALQDAEVRILKLMSTDAKADLRNDLDDIPDLANSGCHVDDDDCVESPKQTLDTTVDAVVDNSQDDTDQKEQKLSTSFAELENEMISLEKGITPQRLTDTPDTLWSLGHDPCFVDPVSLLPMPHLSYICSHTIMEDDMYTSEVNLGVSGIFLETIYAGSNADGTNAFLYNIANGVKQKVPPESYDTYLPCLICIDQHGKVNLTTNNSSKYGIFADSSLVHSGYCRLRPLVASVAVWGQELYSENGRDYFLLNSQFKLVLTIPEHGNKQTCEYKKKYHGYHCLQWPETGSEWLTRDRPSKWPPNDLIDKIKDGGCEVIQRSHPKSRCPAIEWQFVFPRAEKTLLGNISASQLYCYKIFKILVGHQTKHLKQCLHGTHLKAIFFYSSEIIPEPGWKKNIGGCLLYLIAALLKCLRGKCLPNYFIKENNMIDHFENADIDKLLVALESIRLFPVMTIQFIADRYGFQYKWMHNLILKDAAQFSSDKDLPRSVNNVFVPTTIKLAKRMATKASYQKAYRLLEMAYDEKHHASVSKDDSVGDDPDFHGFLKDKIVSVFNSIDQHFLTNIHTKKTGRNLKSEIPVVGTTVKELVGSEDAGEYGDIVVPERFSGSEANGAYFLYTLAIKLGYFKFSKTLLITAIRKTIKALRDDVIDVSEIDEIDLKNEIGRVNCKNLSVWNKNLYEYFLCLEDLCKYTNDYQPMREFMDQLEEICESTPKYITFVTQIWENLGENSRANVFKQRMKDLHPAYVPSTFTPMGELD